MEAAIIILSNKIWQSADTHCVGIDYTCVSIVYSSTSLPAIYFHVFQEKWINVHVVIPTAKILSMTIITIINVFKQQNLLTNTCVFGNQNIRYFMI